MRPEIYEQVRQLVDIEAAASFYGIEIKRNHKASCPFHQDRKPSMSFKNNRFKCFSCGESGGVIDLVAKLHNIEPPEAVKRLNEDFNLTLDIAKPEDKRAAQKRRQDNALYNAFWEWEKKAFILYADKLHRLEEIQRTVRPCADKPEQVDAYAAEVREMPRIEHIVNTFTYGTFEDKLEIFRKCRAEVKKLEQDRRDRKAK